MQGIIPHLPPTPENVHRVWEVWENLTRTDSGKHLWGSKMEFIKTKGFLNQSHTMGPKRQLVLTFPSPRMGTLNYPAQRKRPSRAGVKVQVPGRETHPTPRGTRNIPKPTMTIAGIEENPYATSIGKDIRLSPVPSLCLRL